MESRRKIGHVQRKILLLLLAGVALGLSHSPRRQFRVLKEFSKEWRKINQQNLRNAIRSLYQSKLVTVTENKDGTTTLILSDQGRHAALTYDIENIKLKKTSRWDGKWRLVLSDIPERIKKKREMFRFHLKKLGFRELQKSAYLYPFDCRKEIDFIVEFYALRRYVRFLVVDSVDNDLDLRNRFFGER